jgi:hypothetical protein
MVVKLGILRKKPKIMVFKNRILRRIFGSKIDANGEWRKLHNEDILSLHSQGD